MSKRGGCLVIALLLLLPVMALSSCGSGGSDAAELSCELSIVDHESTVLETVAVAFSDGGSVLDILLNAVQDANLQIEYSGVGAAAYVRGINDLYEFDEGPASGWVYSVNGEEIQESAGAYKPQDGDVIVWQYIWE